MQGNSYCSLKAPSLFSDIQFPPSCTSPTAPNGKSASGPNLAARTASRQKHFGNACNRLRAHRGVHSGWLVNSPFKKPIS
jgi:hypothetical protein